LCQERNVESKNDEAQLGQGSGVDRSFGSVVAIRWCCGPGKRVMSPVVTPRGLDQWTEPRFDLVKQGVARAGISSRRGRFQQALGRCPKSPKKSFKRVERGFVRPCFSSRVSNTFSIFPSCNDFRTPFASSSFAYPDKSLRCQFLMQALLVARPRRTACPS
jgi:hypothetical protein